MEYETPLCKIAHFHGTDKCPQINHSYTPFYYKLFKDRQNTIKKVMELGIGYPPIMRNIPNYKTGASLFMWRDFFPNAQIYGADILPQTMLTSERIKTFLCDETKPIDLENLIDKIGSDIDIFIDDGLHLRDAQIKTCLNVMPLLSKDVIYIIEDINRPDKLLRKLAMFDLFLFEGTNQRRSDKIIVVRHK
jgi:hypothetical protein